jgi:hypothetical protein
MGLQARALRFLKNLREDNRSLKALRNKGSDRGTGIC